MPTGDQVADFLKERGLMRPDESPWQSFDPQDSERYRIDWNAFFPRRRQGTREGEYEWDIYGDDWLLDVGENFWPDLQEALESAPPTEDEIEEMAAANTWDICAWYQPVHFFGPDWGIYIRQDCILAESLRIARYVPKPVRLSKGLGRTLIRASTYSCFLHEQYHHKVESLGIRLEVVELRNVYARYMRGVYGPATGADDQLEEALANASMYHRLLTDPYERWISLPIAQATRAYLKDTFRHEPPGYRQAIKYLTYDSFEQAEDRLHSIVHEATLSPSRHSSDWAIATRLIQSLFRVTDNIWVVVTPGGRRIFPVLP